MYDGYVLFCNNSSQQQCLSRKRYTCSDKESKLIDELKTGTVVFLYNTDDKSLLGPFTTLSEGDELDAGTWVMDVDENNMPYEDVKVTWEDLHILQDAPDKLPFLNAPETCKLSTTQTQRTLDLLKEGPLYLNEKDKLK
jgi:Development and cell death domain